MIDERLESALAWRKKNNLESIRLNKFNRKQKKKRFKKKDNRRRITNRHNRPE